MYSRTVHRDYQRIYFYSLNKVIYVALGVVLTGAIIAKLEQAIAGGML